MKKFIYTIIFTLCFIVPQIISNDFTITPNLAYVIPNKPANFTITNFPAIAVANYFSNSVSIIDTSNYKVIKTITQSEGKFNVPLSVAYSPDGDHIAVDNFGSETISIIDTSTYKVIKIITKTEGNFDGPNSATYSPHGKHIAVTNAYSNTVSIIDTSSYTVSKIITKTEGNFDGLNSVTYSPNGQYIAAANIGPNSVYIIDTSKYKVIKIITKTEGNFDGPTSAAYSPNGKHIAVANARSNSVSIIDTSNYKVIKTITQSEGKFHVPLSVAYSPDGDHIAVANYGSNTVSIIDTSNYKVIKIITKTEGKFDGPASVAYSPLAALASYVNITGPNGYSQSKISLEEGNNAIKTNPITTSGTYTFTFYNSSGIQIGSQDIIINFFFYNVELKPLIQSLNSGSTLILKASAEGGVGPYKYLWTKPDGSTIETNSSIFYKQNIVPTDSGTYFVTVTDSTGKSITSKSALVFVN